MRMAGLIQLINQYMLTEFVPFMCKEHGLEEEDVAATWMRFVKNEQPDIQTKDLPEVMKKAPKAADPIKVEEKPNEKMKLATLKDICRSKGIKVTGTKKQLLTRIEEHDATNPVKTPEKEVNGDDTPTDVESESVPKKKIVPKKIAPKKNEKPDVIKAMEEKKPEIVICTDKYGNVIHEETGIAFSHDEEEIDGVKCRYVIGYRLESGHLEELTAEKMELCDQYGFRYRVPDNFDEL